MEVQSLTHRDSGTPRKLALKNTHMHKCKEHVFALFLGFYFKGPRCWSLQMFWSLSSDYADMQQTPPSNENKHASTHTKHLLRFGRMCLWKGQPKCSFVIEIPERCENAQCSASFRGLSLEIDLEPTESNYMVLINAFVTCVANKYACLVLFVCSADWHFFFTAHIMRDELEESITLQMFAVFKIFQFKIKCNFSSRYYLLLMSGGL